MRIRLSFHPKGSRPIHRSPRRHRLHFTPYTIASLQVFTDGSAVPYLDYTYLYTTRKQYWEERPRVTCTPFLVCYKLILASRSDSGTRLIRRSYYKVRSFSAPNSRWKNMNDGMNQRRKDGLMDSRERHRYIILFVIQRKPFLLVLETSEP